MTNPQFTVIDLNRRVFFPAQPLRLRSHISSYLDVPGLCAERATARESYSRKASAAALLSFLFVRRLAAQVFVAQLMELCRPDTQFAQMGSCEGF